MSNRLSPPDSSALPQSLAAFDARQLISCWRTIGIHGDRSCPELTTVIHCHNCSTYTRSARQLFERPQPDLESPHPTPTRPTPPPTNEVESSSLGLFRISQHWFALPAQLFQQVLPHHPIRPIPHRSNDILQGLVNIQGELLLCVSLQNLLDIQTNPSATIPRLIILEWETERWSFVIDEFHGIESIAPTQLITPPSTVLTNTTTFTHSLLPWNEHTVNCLDEFLLFKALERTALS